MCPALCVAIPRWSQSVFVARWVGAAMFGYTPTFWHGGPLNLAEAAALRDQGEVARLIETGTDPNTEYALRSNVLLGQSRDAARGGRARTTRGDCRVIDA
jgi:hypothetical protein